MLEDSTIGKLILAFTCICFLYYTLWVFATPFIEPDTAILDIRYYFPPIQYALIIPCALISGLIGCLYAFTWYNLYCV
ncbi:hypothetical protein M8J75_007142 [Diaphorina citri]|nr:hypothetical protein M8J75_007142 [Diaphorina citri]KAI5717673.1 hypothetical protein M8J77_009453 [Diaphorina citri]